MITVEPDAPSSASHSKSGQKAGFCVVLLLLVGALTFSIWFFGSPDLHETNPHPLYTSFETSPNHKKLTAKLLKNKKCLLVGTKSDGLFNYLEHYANLLNKKGKTVYVEQYNSGDPFFFEIAKEINIKVLATFGQLKTDSNWIVVSENGEIIPEELITEIIVNYPSSHILVVTTTKKQKLKGFKSFKYQKLEGETLKKSMSSAFGINNNVADILSDYHKTDQELLQNMDVQKFEPKLFLGEQYIDFNDLSKQGKKVLKQLCKSGQIISKKKQKQTAGLAQYGVIFARNSPRWQDEQKILNYQLQNGVDCKNIVATAEDLKQYQEAKEKQIEVLKAQEQQAKRKQAEAKAAQQKLQEEKKEAQETAKAKKQSKKGKKKSQEGKKAGKKKAKSK